MRSSLIILFFMLMYVSAKSQKWQPGYFFDTKGNKVPGLIRTNPSGKGPIANEGFIEYKDNEKAKEIKLSASDIKYFVAGRDSFVVAHAPQNESWAKHEFDFVKVELDEPLKLYVYGGGSKGGGGFKIRPDVGFGIGGGSYGGYGGGGVGISLGNGGGGSSRITYYFGATPAELSQITPQNFVDVMSDMMADEPQAVEAIQTGKYRLDKMQALIAYYRKLKSSTNTKP
ncbi:hypothetical protein [Mucilaginibacter lacusdianchii]|uniref:hypothetical protein n=1 Tax=Mucilaginibacter lacusdianchii TaxID=2684211 RepID=UPI00131ADC42|nr:hypothetical protein [Mucilaginibacter sp. JXJ CY 39]